MKAKLRPPALWGRRAWQAYLATHPAMTQGGKHSIGTDGADESRCGGDSPDSTVTLRIKL